MLRGLLLLLELSLVLVGGTTRFLVRLMLDPSWHLGARLTPGVRQDAVITISTTRCTKTQHK